MIVGVGVDIVEIGRIKEVMERNNKFMEKVFEKSEIEYLKSRNLRPEYVAGRFAAKEAVSKALGTGFRGFNLRDIVIESNELGKPLVLLKNKAKNIAEQNGTAIIHLSISHGMESAIAYAVMEVI